MSAEWAHFVALGVFAYTHGGSTAVGVAGLMRLLPAALLAPFASSLGDRFRRERFLLAVVLLGAAALVVSAVGVVMDDRSIVFAAASAVGICSTLFRPRSRRAAPVARAYGEGVDRCERRDLDDREPRHADRSARRRGAGCRGRCRIRLRRRRPGLAGVGRSPRPRLGAGWRRDAWQGRGSRCPGGVQGDRGGSARAAPRRSHCIADIRARMPERPDRRHRLPGASQGSDGCRLPDGGDGGRRPDRSARCDLAARRAAGAAVRLGPGLLGPPDHADRALPLLRSGSRPASRARRRQQHPRRRGVHAAPAHRSRRGADSACSA